MKKYILPILLCFTLILSACSKGQETREHSEVIRDGKTLGYEYTVIKEQNTYIWKVGYKGNISKIEENVANKGDLINYMHTVNDSKSVLFKLIVSVLYLLILIITMLILYKKNRKIFKVGSPVIILFAIIAAYIAFKSSLDLNFLLQDAKYYYSRLTN